MHELLIGQINNNSLDGVKQIILDLFRSNDNKALTQACKKGCLDIIKYMFACGITINDVRHKIIAL